MDHKMFALGEVKAVEDSKNPNGEFDVVLSAPTLDRDGEVIDAKVFEPLPDHITFDIDHGMSTASTVGSGKPFYDDEGRLRVKGTYSSIPRAQEVRTLVAEGHIRTTSVAFMGAVRQSSEKDGTPHVVKAELLNGAFVPIPSNRESVVLSAKAYSEKAGARNAAKDAERLQTVHDLIVQNGATCDVPEKSAPVTDDVVRKAHGMTANDLRDALDRALREAYGAEDTWIWVRDYSDEWVVFELEGPEERHTLRQSYTVTDGAPSLSGDTEEVVVHTTYEPATPAPETPSEEDGKSPASNVVEMARLRADIARLSLD